MAAITLQSLGCNSSQYALNYKGESYIVEVKHKLDKDNKPVMKINRETGDFSKWRSIRNVVWQHHISHYN